MKTPYFKPTKENTLYTYLFLIFMILLSLDSWTKRIAVEQLKDSDDIDLIPGVLSLHYLENTGAAFGILKGHMWIFYSLTAVVCIGIVWIIYRMPFKKRFLPLYITLSVLLAGAVGNLIDRVTHRYVVDFIYFYLINFPVFNVADICVTCATAFLVFLLMFYYKDEDFK